MSIKFCPFCGKPWNATPFCAYCGKDLRAFFIADSTHTEGSQPKGTQSGADKTVGATTTRKITAEQAEQERKFKATWDIRDGVLKRHKGSEKNIVIPDSVTSIGDATFRECPHLTRITLPRRFSDKLFQLGIHPAHIHVTYI